jgi:hypothetical protein
MYLHPIPSKSMPFDSSADAPTQQSRLRLVYPLMALVAASALSACGGGDSASTLESASADVAAATSAENEFESAQASGRWSSRPRPPTRPSKPAPSPAPAPAPAPAPSPSPAPAPAPSPAPAPPAGAGRAVPMPLYGVTVDDVDDLPAITESLSRLSRMPTTRIVFDEYQPASDYRKAAVAINKVSYVMGEILDSQYLTTVNVQGYLDRTREYLAALGDVVDIWEIANEINGEWLGNNADVVAKMSGAYDIAKGQGRTTALTLYYNQDCWSKRSNEMFTWAQANIPERMKQGLDYVLVSYYEEDCNNLKPDWNAVFKRLETMFPNSRLGFGEVGTSKAADKAAYLQRYYALKPPVAKWAGGHFWWYFKQDMVPYTKPLWNTLNQAFANTP